jgi:hypothetical protein
LKLNKQLIVIVKEKQRMDNRTSAFNFMAGDAVKYNGKFGPTTAKVIEVKRTKVVVESTRGRFLVPAAMLSKV